jgi:hypothetical protein
MIDEKAKELGTHLVLPPWLESMRKDLEKILPQVNLPKKEKEKLVVKKQFNNEEN